MFGLRFAIVIVALLTLAVEAKGQSTAQPPVPAATTKPPKTMKTKAPAVQRVPLEAAPPTPPTAAETAQQAQQRAQDQRLLQQQQAQSAAAAQVTNQIVQTAQKQQDKVQNEVRIQDAPGPAQTGVVPAAGPPVVPANTSSQNIQDAPGPAQTIAPPATVAVPAATLPAPTVPATIPPPSVK